MESNPSKDINLTKSPNHTPSSINPSDQSRLKNKHQFILSRKIRWIQFFLITYINCIPLTVGGIMGAAITSIKKEFNLNDQQFATLNSVNSIGTLTSSLLFSFIINLVNRKFLVIFCLSCEVSSSLMAFYSNSYLIFLFSRFLSGLAIFTTGLYIPVWVAQFSLHKWKTFMMTVVQLAPTTGILGGYAMNLFFGAARWRHGFFTEAFLLFAAVVGFVLIPNIYYRGDIFYYSPDKEMYPNRDSTRDDSIFAIGEEKKVEEENDEKIEEVKSAKEEGFVTAILCNPFFMLISLVRSCLMMVGLCIGVWYSEYIEINLNEKDPKQILISYALSSVVATSLGTIAGGFINSKTGGYKSKNCPRSMLALMASSALVGNFLPHCKTLLTYNICICIHNFFNSGIFSVSTGYMFEIIPKKLGGVANGFAGLFMTSTVFLPGPLIYGTMKMKYGDYYSFIGLMLMSVVGTVLMVIVNILDSKKDEEKEDGKLLNNLKENEDA